MKVIDLFAGAGGLSEGFRRNGVDIVAHVEKDYNASLTLKTREAYYYCLENNKMSLYLDYLNKKITREEFYAHIPDEILTRVLNIEISKENYANIISQIDTLVGNDKIAGIIGGPPCQAYSIAGRSRDKNKMKDDPRNFLYKYYLQFIEYYNPYFFIFENVQGLLSAYNGKIFEEIQSEMKLLGYNITCDLLDASDFGVLQSRKRIIISGWKDDLDLPHLFFKKEKSTYTIQELFSDLPSIQAGEVKKEYVATGSKHCLQELKIRTNDWDTLTYHVARPVNSRDAQIYSLCCNVWNKEKRQIKYNELPTNLITHKNLDGFLDRYRIVNGNGISHTVVAHISKDGHHFIHPDIEQCRSISVREAARIQSFPDDYYFESSRTSAFQQIGNAVPPLMADRISKELLAVLKKNLKILSKQSNYKCS